MLKSSNALTVDQKLSVLSPPVFVSNGLESEESHKEEVDNNLLTMPQLKKPTSIASKGHLNRASGSNHTFLSADGAKVSFVTAKQTEAEILEYQ